MKLQSCSRWTPLLATAALVVACMEPTGPSLNQSFDEVDPVVVTFAATQGLPGGPIGVHNGPPFMGGMPFAGAPGSAANGRGPGAAFPDSIKLSDAQKAQIQTLIEAFHTANAADLDAMKAAHQAARAARQAGKSREEIKAILDAAKPAADRVRAAGESLRTAIGNVLTASQRAWLEAHKPDRPPRTP
jgi:Spy/CpxP family protein refolding chaperone